VGTLDTLCIVPKLDGPALEASVGLKMLKTSVKFTPALRSPENLYTFGYHLGQVYLSSRSSSYMVLSQASDCLPCFHLAAPLVPLGIIS
jgi:hypothetical protein